MAVADVELHSPPPPPPPARIVVAVLYLAGFAVGFALSTMLALGRVLYVAAGALPYLGFAVAWVISAASAAQVVARRAWGESSGPFLFLQALTDLGLKVCVYSIFVMLLALAAVLLCRLCLVYVIAAVSGSGSEFKQIAFGAIMREWAADLFKLPRTAVLGLIADVAFSLLMVAGLLVAMISPHLEGLMSQGEIIGCVIMDVGIFGMHATACFVIIPALVLNVWRDDQVDRKAPSQFC